jgi:hypothetical protein
MYDAAKHDGSFHIIFGGGKNVEKFLTPRTDGLNTFACPMDKKTTKIKRDNIFSFQYNQTKRQRRKDYKER